MQNSPWTLKEETGDEAEAVEDRIDELMDAFNREHLGDENERRIVLTLRGTEGRLVGAAVGWAYWDYLYLDNLWVDPAARGQGAGTRLLRAMEDAARARGLGMVQLYTFSFEAPDFYRRQGYTLAGQIPDSPTGTTNHWFYKRV